MLRALAVALSAVAVALIVLAMRDIARGTDEPGRGLAIRVAALLAFAGAVALNALAR